MNDKLAYSVPEAATVLSISQSQVREEFYQGRLRGEEGRQAADLPEMGEDGQQPMSGIVVHHYERIDKWRCESHGRVTEDPCWHRLLISLYKEDTP